MTFLTHRCSAFPQVEAGKDRLDFTFYEFDLARFEEVVNAMMELTLDFGKRTGFQPGGLAMYFVKRTGRKPSASFSGPQGAFLTTLQQMKSCYHCIEVYYA